VIAEEEEQEGGGGGRGSNPQLPVSTVYIAISHCSEKHTFAQKERKETGTLSHVVTYNHSSQTSSARVPPTLSAARVPSPNLTPQKPSPFLSSTHVARPTHLNPFIKKRKKSYSVTQHTVDRCLQLVDLLNLLIPKRHFVSFATPLIVQRAFLLLSEGAYLHGKVVRVLCMFITVDM
jgi:hypothetical protein